MKRLNLPSLILLVFLATSIPTSAALISVDVIVGGKVQPWQFSNVLNSAYQYGINDGLTPVAIGTSNGFGFETGDTLAIEYLSGTVRAGSGWGAYGAGGNTSYVENNFNGSSGKPFPSKYMSSASYPIYLMELVGTFADSTGAIVGTPFEIGTGLNLTIPSGATYLLLGLNDDIFYDNLGSLLVRITGPDEANIPEPATMLLLGGGLIGVALYGRRRV